MNKTFFHLSGKYGIIRSISWITLTNSPKTRRKAKAVQYLIDHIPDETMRDVKNAMDKNGKDWWVGHHHGFGTGVRNLLREGGFDWGPIDMDDLWVGLVERAVRKKFRS